MQNAGPDSPRLRPALLGLALAALLAAAPAAADEPAFAAGAFDMASRPGEARDADAEPSSRWSFLPEAVTLRLSGAGGAVDPGSAEFLGVISLDIRL